MHELSVSSAIVDTAIRHAGGRRVSVVHVEVGTLRQVVPKSLEFYFGITSRDTACEGAELDLRLISALMRCSQADCGREWDPAPEPMYEGDPAALLPQFRCPGCNAAGAEILAGNELMVESIDLAAPEPEPEPEPVPDLTQPADQPALSHNGAGAHSSHQPN